MIKFSHQREAILHDLRNRKDHPTADMVYESVRVTCPNISLGTVYRNLALLTEEGQILKLTTGKGPDHFDGCTDPHVHFMCSICGKVVDMEYFPTENLKEKAAESFDGSIEGLELQFYGKCGECSV